jgi:GNAT superfamily N-acetyltransferase
MALIAVVGTAGQEEVVAVGRYMTDPANDMAEMAFVVRDDWQRKQIGTYLFNKLVEIASSQGIRKFHAEVLSENSGMLKIFYRSGLKVETSSGEGVVSVDLELPEPDTET